MTTNNNNNNSNISSITINLREYSASVAPSAAVTPAVSVAGATLTGDVYSDVAELIVSFNGNVGDDIALKLAFTELRNNASVTARELSEKINAAIDSDYESRGLFSDMQTLTSVGLLTLNERAQYALNTSDGTYLVLTARRSDISALTAHYTAAQLLKALHGAVMLKARNLTDVIAELIAAIPAPVVEAVEPAPTATEIVEIDVNNEEINMNDNNNNVSSISNSSIISASIDRSEMIDQIAQLRDSEHTYNTLRFADGSTFKYARATDDSANRGRLALLSEDELSDEYSKRMSGLRFSAIMIYTCDGDESSVVRNIDVDSDEELNTVLLEMIDELYDDSAMSDDEREQIFAELGLDEYLECEAEKEEKRKQELEKAREHKEELINELMSLKCSEYEENPLVIDEDTEFRFGRTPEVEDYEEAYEREQLEKMDVEEIEEQIKAYNDDRRKLAFMIYSFDGEEFMMHRTIIEEDYKGVRSEMAALLDDVYDGSEMTDEEYNIIAEHLRLPARKQVA